MVDSTYPIRRSNLHDLREQIRDALSNIDDRIDAIVKFTGAYIFDDALVAGTLAGEVRFNNADEALVTRIFINNTGANATDNTLFLGAIAVDDLIEIADTSAGHLYQYTVQAIPTNLGTEHEVTVAYTNSTALVVPADGNILNVTIESPVYWDDILNKPPTFPPSPHTHDHNGGDITGIGPDDHHPRDHNLYHETHSDVIEGGGLIVRSLLATNDAASFRPETRVNWRGNWGPGTYYTHDMVLDVPYTMVANTETTDRAAPQPLGDPATTLPDVPLWSAFQQNARVGSGHTYTFNESVEVQAMRVWVPSVGPNIGYLLTIVQDGIYTQIPVVDPTTGWNVVAVGNTVFVAGSAAIIYLEAQNSGSSTIVTGGWQRQGDDNNLEPTAGGWLRNNANTVVRIHFTDLDTIDRQTELEGMIVGTEIQFAETADPTTSVTYRVTSPPVTLLNSVEYGVIQIDSGVTIPAVGIITTMTADVPVASPTDFVGIVNNWTGNQPPWGTIQSFLAFDGVDQGAAPDNAYGVDILVQRLTISPDWDIVAASIQTGGGGGGTPFPEAPIDGYGYARQNGDWSNTPLFSYVDLADDGEPAHSEGRVWWDAVENSLSYFNDVADVTVNTGQEMVMKCRNASGATITNGQAVRVTGAQGNRPRIGLAQADDPANATVLGLATHDIANNADGYITVFGVVRGFDTSPWTEGDALYLSPTVPGGLQNTKPVSPDVVVGIGVVTVENPSNGWIAIRPRSVITYEDIADTPDLLKLKDWIVDNTSHTASWYDRTLVNVPPTTIDLPDVVNPGVEEIQIWNGSNNGIIVPDTPVTIAPFSGRFFVVDGNPLAVDEDINIKPGEMVRITGRVAADSYNVAIDAAGGFAGAGSFGLVPDPGTETGKVLTDSGQWVQPTTIPAGGVAIGYNFTTSLGVPGAGEVGLNNADPNLATAVNINDLNALGNDTTVFIEALFTGDLIGLLGTSGGTYYFAVSGPPVDNVGNWTIPVSNNDITGVIPDAQLVDVNFIGDPASRVPPGGADGEVLTKQSATDYDMNWEVLPPSGIPEAPQDGTPYGRQDLTWVGVAPAGHTHGPGDITDGYVDLVNAQSIAGQKSFTDRVDLDGDGDRLLLDGSVTDFIWELSGSELKYRLDTVSDHVFLVGGITEAMRITNEGWVGIGRTARETASSMLSVFDRIEIVDDVDLATGGADLDLVGADIKRVRFKLPGGSNQWSIGTRFQTSGADNTFYIRRESVAADSIVHVANGGGLLVDGMADVAADAGVSAPFVRITNTDQFAGAGEVVGRYEFFSVDTSDPNRVTGYMENIARDAGVQYELAFGTKPSSGSDAVERMRINASGNVGIGETNPAAKLEVAGETWVWGRMQVRMSNGDYSAEFRSNNGTTTDIVAGASLPLTFLTNGAERMRIDTAGNVGIGETSPEELLHISGPVSNVIDHNILITEFNQALNKQSTDIGEVIGSITWRYDHAGLNVPYAQISPVNYNDSGTGWFNLNDRVDAGLGFFTSMAGTMSQVLLLNWQRDQAGFRPSCALGPGDPEALTALSAYSNSWNSLDVHTSNTATGSSIGFYLGATNNWAISHRNGGTNNELQFRYNNVEKYDFHTDGSAVFSAAGLELGAGQTLFAAGLDVQTLTINGVAAHGLTDDTPPATATDPGVQGEARYDASFLYICVAANTWRRVALAAW